MTAKTYTVYLRAQASLSVKVTVDEQDDPEVTREAAIEAAFDNGQFLCAQCSGWGQDWDLDLGEWEIEDGADAVVEEES